MAVLKEILFFASLWGWFFLIKNAGKLRVHFVPAVTMAGVSLALYAGGLLGLLRESSAFLYSVGLAGAVAAVVLWIKGGRVFPRWSLFGVIFTVTALLFAALILNLKFLHYDNFSHWATAAKYMLSADRFADMSTRLVVFKDYPPGAAVWIYYVCRFAGYSQGMMLLAQNSLVFACFFAVFGMVRERRRFLLYSFLGMGCAMLSYLNLTIRINNLLVDFLLPLLVMAAVSVSYRMEEDCVKASVCVAALLGYAAIVKDVGVIFAAVGLIYHVWRLLTRRKKNVPALFLSAGAFLPYLAWKWYLSTELAGFEGKFSVETGRASAAAPELYEQIIRQFYHSSFSLTERSFQAFLLCTALAAGGVVYARFFLKRKWDLWKVWLVGVIMLGLYYAGLLFLYLYSMPADEAVRLAGFDRYTCSIMTLFAGILVMGAEADMENSFAVGIDERGAYRAYSSPEAKRRYQTTVLFTFIIGMNFLYSEFNGLIDIRKKYMDSLPGQVESLTGDRWYMDGKEDDARYLVVASDTQRGGENADDQGQVTSGEVRYVCRYFLWAPHVDVTDRLDAERLREAEQGYDYILVLDNRSAETGYFKTPGLYEVQDFPYSYQKSTGHGIR